jgi:hypothetical protein
MQGDQLTSAAAGLFNFTVFRKNFILLHLVVFYCVIVDENESVKHQRCHTNKKYSEKVFFNFNIKNLIFELKNNVNSNRKKKVKCHNRQTRGKGKTVCVKIKSDSQLGKWNRLRRRGNKQNIKFLRFRKKWKEIHKFKLLEVILKSTNLIISCEKN